MSAVPTSHNSSSAFEPMTLPSRDWFFRSRGPSSNSALVIRRLFSLGNTRQATACRGRPQLTAGIRAGSYAHECSNLRKPASNEGFCRLLLSCGSSHYLSRNTDVARAPVKSSLQGAFDRHGHSWLSLLYLFERLRRIVPYGTFLDPLALHLCHNRGKGRAGRRSQGAGLLARRHRLRLLQPARFDRLCHRPRYGSRPGRGGGRAGSARTTLLHLPQCFSLHVGPCDGDALCAS